MSAIVRLSVSDAMKEWLDREAASKGFATPDAYALEVLMRAQRVSEERELIDQKLTEAIASGESSPMERADWEKIRERARALSRGTE
jgi:hypothetical protein